MNNFQNISSGSGMLKNFYADEPVRRNAQSPMHAALKNRRQKLSQTLLDPEIRQGRGMEQARRILNQYAR